MSDIVGGSISRGRGNEQVVVVFTGRLTRDEWAAFVAALVQCAKDHSVVPNVHPKQTKLKQKKAKPKKPNR